MDLEKINEEYKKLKQNLEKYNQQTENLKYEVGKLADDRILTKGKIIEAKRNGDKAEEKRLEQELNNIDKSIKDVKEKAEKMRFAIGRVKQAIDKRIEQIKQNPAMSKHLDSVLATKYSRRLNALDKERLEVGNKKVKFETMKALIDSHPTISNNMKGMISAKEELNKLEEQLKTLPSTDKSKIPLIRSKMSDAQNKYDTNRRSFMNFVGKKGIDINESDISDLVTGGVVRSKDGQVDLDTMLNKRIKSANKQLKGFNKQIANNEIALRGIRADVVKTDVVSTGKNANISSTTDKNPKWWQFIKKFKRWNEGRKQNKLPEPNKEPVEDKNEFKNSLKYDIVRDIVEQMEKDDLKVASRERRDATKDDNER